MLIYMHFETLTLFPYFFYKWLTQKVIRRNSTIMKNSRKVETFHAYFPTRNLGKYYREKKLS